MDQVKSILAVLKKQIFWVLCLLVLITSTVVWMMAVGAIEKKSQEHLARIQSAMQDAQGVVQITQHPNEEITKAYNAQTTKLKNEVFQVWDELYKKQRESVLIWPEPLGEQFINFIQGVQFGDPIHVDLRETYQNYVKTRWEELPKIIQAKPEKEESKAASSKALPDWIVIWKDQDSIRRQLFSQKNPTSEWVWVTQEDLWIYTNLLNIIKQTNQGAIGPHNAVISSIINMDVGQQAAGAAGATEQRIKTGSGEDGFNDDSSSAENAGGGGEGLLGGRYVDEVGVPIADGSTVKNNEYKMVPVRLVLRMDPKEIPQLIVNCSNADLPVEIQQVRMNVNAGAKGKRVEAPELSAEDRKAGRKVPHVEVAMQGVIYIFNPPNREKLKMAAAGSSDPASATEAFGTEGEAAGEAPPADVTSVFEETPAEGTSPTETPMDTTSPMDTAPMSEGTEPMTTSPADAIAPAATEPPPVEPEATEPATAEPAETEPAEVTPPATGEPAPAKSLEDLFE